MKTSELVNFVIAIWGAITGTVAITLSFVQFFIERPRLKVRWLRNFSMFTVGPDGKHREDADRYARLVVTNVGRQPIRTSGAYMVRDDNDRGLIFGMFTDGLLDNSRSRVLSPEQPSTEYLVRDDPSLDSIVYLGVNDGFGRTHGLWLVPWYRRIGLRRKMKIRPGRRKSEDAKPLPPN